jgi:hypothetical protein
MQIVGFNFEKIQAERKNQPKGKLQVSSNINIKSVSQEKIELVKDKPALKFDFEFKVEYKPSIAEISLQGSTLLLVEKEQAKEVIKKWKNKRIPDDIRIPLFNMILTKSNLKALQLEEELNLPTHIPFPRIKPQSSQDSNRSYAG